HAISGCEAAHRHRAARRTGHRRSNGVYGRASGERHDGLGRRTAVAGKQECRGCIAGPATRGSWAAVGCTHRNATLCVLHQDPARAIDTPALARSHCSRRCSGRAPPGGTCPSLRPVRTDSLIHGVAFSVLGFSIEIVPWDRLAHTGPSPLKLVRWDNDRYQAERTGLVEARLLAATGPIQNTKRIVREAVNVEP